jgi:ATP-binding cassette, subfamily B, bacterial MsbA
MHSTLKDLLHFIRPYRSRLFIALGGTIVFTLLSVLPPLVMRYYVDNVLSARNWDLLPLVLSAIVGVPLLSVLIRFGNMHLLMLASRRFLGNIRLSMYRRILNLSMRYHGSASSGMLVGRMMDDVNKLQRLLTGETVQMLIDGIVFVFALTVTFILSWKLTLVLCAVLALYVAVYGYFSRWIRRATASFRITYDQIAGRLQETLLGVRLVRIYNREEWEHSHFLENTSRGLDQALSSSLGSTTLSTLSTGIAGYGSTVIVGLGAYLVLHQQMTFGDLHAFNSYIWMAIMPAIRLTTLAGQLSETFVSVDRILAVIRETPDIESKPGAPAIQRGNGTIEFDHVGFGYDRDTPLFRDLSLRVQGGTTVALVGPTGCGKTTLTHLLMRFWDVESGRITIDGTDIRDVRLRSLRELFGVVLQEPVVFDGALAENIAYGRPDATRAEIEAAAQAAEIHAMARGFPDGFDSVIGSNGYKLSVGEKQRVSIARAILRNPLILIMDEATSSLDSNSEALIQKALERVLRNRTAFVIAHRLSTIHDAHMIVVMDGGGIVAVGTHEELMAKEHGLYRALYRRMRGHESGEVQ